MNAKHPLNRNLLAFLGLLGLVVGSGVGYFIDYASGLLPDPARLAAVQQCWVCPNALFPFLYEVVYLNLGQLIGSILGLGAGLALGYGWWIMNRGRLADQEATRRRDLEALANETLRRRVQQLTSLSTSSQALVQSPDLTRILTRALEEAVRVTGADCGTALLLDLGSTGGTVGLRVGDAYEPNRMALLESVVTATGQTRIIRDFQVDSASPLHEGVRSALLAPLSRDETVIGLIHLHSTRPDAFDIESLEFVESLAAHTTLAVGNLRRYDEELARAELFRRRADQLQHLSQTAAQIRADRPLAVNLRTVALGAQKACGFGTVIVGVLDAHSGMLRRLVSVGLPASALEQLETNPEPWARLSPFLREEFRISRSYFIPYDQAADLYQALESRAPDRSSLADTHEATLWRPADILLVPIYGPAEEIFGLLSLDEPQDGRRPTRQVIEVLEAFAAEAALAVESDRLYDEARQAAATAREQAGEWQERAGQLTGLSEAESVLASALRVEDVIGLTLDQLGRFVGNDGAMLWLRDAAHERFRPAGVRGEKTPERHEVAQALADGNLLPEIVVTGNGLAVADVQRDGRFPANAADLLHSWLGVPLANKGEVVGLLAVDKREINYYRPAHIELLQAFARHAAVALENARLYEESVQGAVELNERSQRLALLTWVAGELSGTLEVERVLQIATREMAAALGVGRARGLVMDEGRGSSGLVAAGWPASKTDGGVPPSGLVLLEQLRESQTPLLVEDGQGELRPERLEWLGVEVKAALWLPLIAGETVIGLVGLGDTRSARRFSAGEVELAEALAGQTAVAAQNARLYEKTQRRLAEVAAISQFGRAVSSTIDLKQLYETVKVQVSALVGAESVYLALYDEVSEQVRYELVVEGGQEKPAGVGGPNGFVDHVLQTQRPLLLANGDIEARFEELALRPDGDESQLKSYLGVPLMMGDEAIGVLAVGDSQRPEAFNENHARLLATVAPHLAAALENARLYEAAQQATAAAREQAGDWQERAGELSGLNEAESIVASALRVEEVIERVLEQLSRIVNYDGVTLWLRDQVLERMRLMVVRGEEKPDKRRRLADLLTESNLLSEIEVTGNGVVIVDVKRDGRFPTSPAGVLQSWLGVPLLNKGEVVGLLAVDKQELGYYRPSQIDLVQAFARHAAVALENARLYEESVQGAVELNERSQRLALLSRVAGELSGTLEVERVLQIAVREIAGALGVSRARGLVVDEGRGSSGLVAAGWPEAASNDTVPASGLVLLEQVRETQLPLLVEDGQIEARPERVEWLGSEVKTAVWLPLTAGEDVVGLIGLGETRPGRRFSGSDVELAQALANQAAVAAQNARLYEKTQRRLTEVAAISQFGRAVSSTIDLKQLYETVKVQVGALVGAETMYLAVYDPARGEVRYELMVEGGEEKAGGAGAPSGLVGHILQTQRTLLLNGNLPERFEELALRPSADEGQLKSYLGVPLLLGEQAIGVLAVGDLHRANAFDEGHVRLLATMAAQAAVAIGNARRYSESLQRAGELNDRSQRLAFLSRVAGELSGTLEIERVLQITVRELAGALGVNRARALVVDEGRGVSGVVAAAWPESGANGLLPASGLMLLDQLRETQAPLVVEDGQSEERVERVEWLGADVKAAVWLPLMAGEKVIGLVGLGETRPGRRFSGADIELAQALANQTAVAAQNAGLYQKTQRRLTEVAAVSQFGRAVSSTIDLDQLYQTVKVQVESLIGAETIYLAVYDQAREEVNYELVVEDGAPKPRGSSLPGGLVGHILQTQRALLLNGEIEARLDELAIPVSFALDKPAGEGARLKSYLGVPLLVGDRPMGVLAVADLHRPNAFEEDDFRLLSALSVQVASAIENARRYEQAHSVQQEMERQVNRLTSNLAGERERYEQAQTQSKALELQIGERTGELAQERERYAAAHALSQDLERQLQERTEELAAERERLEQARLQGQELETQLQTRAEELAAERERLEQAHALAQDLEQQIQSRVHELAAEREQLEQAQLETQTLAGHLEERTEELARETRRYEETSAQVQELEHQLEDRVQELAAERERLEQASQQAQAEQAELQSRLETSANELAAERERYEQAHTLAQDLEQQVQARTQELAAERAHLEEARALHQELERTVQQRADELAGERERLEQAHLQIQELEGDLAERVREFAGERERLEQAGRQAQEIQAQLEDQLETSANELAAERERLAQSRLQIQEQEDQLVGRAQELAAERRQLEQARLQLHEMAADLAGRVQELAAEREGHKQARLQALELKHQVQERTAELEREHERHEQARGLLHELERQLQDRTQALAKEYSRFEQTQQSAQQLELQAQGWSDDLSRLRERYDQAESSIHELEDVIQKRDALLVEERERYEQAELTIQELDALIRRHEADLARERERQGLAQLSASELEIRVREREADLAQAQTAIQALQAELAQSRAAAQALQVDLAQSQSATEALQAEVAQSQSATEALQAEVAQAQSATEALQAEAAQSQAATETLQAEIAQARAAVQALQAEVTQSQAATQALQAEAARSQAAIQALEADLAHERERQIHLAASVGQEREAQLAQELERQTHAYAQAHAASQQFEATLNTRDQELAHEQESRRQALETIQNLESQIAGRTDELARQQSRLDALLAIIGDVSASPDADRMFRQGLALLCDVLNAEHGSVFLPDPVSGRLMQRAAFNLTTALRDTGRPASFKNDEGLPGWVFKHQEALVISNLSADARWKKNPLPGGRGYRSALAIPLASGGETLGALLFLSTQPEAFSAGQVPLLGAVAAQMTAVYHNAELRRLLSERPVAQPAEAAAAAEAPRVAPAVVPEAPPTRAAQPPVRRPVVVSPEALAVGPSGEFEPLEPLAPLAPARAPVRLMGMTIALLGLAVIAAFVLVLAVAPQVPQLATALGLGAGGPTQAPTALASATAGAPTQVAIVATASPAVSETAAPPSATASPRPSATATPDPTDTATRTASPTRTPSPTATLPGGVQALAVVSLPSGLSARLRDAPGGTVIAGVLDGAQVEVLEGREERDDIVWVRIRDEAGNVGWIAESLLEILER